MIKTLYLCRQIFNSEMQAIKKAILLDRLINCNDYKKATKYIKSLEISNSNQKKLIRCVFTYKISC